MPHAHKPRGAIQHTTEIVALAQFGIPGVYPHPHPQRRETPVHLRYGALRIQCGPHRVMGRREHRVSPVACRLNHMAVVGPHRLAQNLVVTDQRDAHLPAMLVPQPRRTLHIGEQERHGASRQRFHNQSVSLQATRWHEHRRSLNTQRSP
jgi:hypothetical protein